VNYKVRSSYISDFFNQYHVPKNGYILDLACGTGSVSAELIKRGYRIIGMDKSAEMLSVADKKLCSNAELIQAKMQNFALKEPVDAVICLLDSLNHLETQEDVKKCFQCVHYALKENGLFIFDMNTVYKHHCVLADNTFVFDREEYFLSWDNELLEKNRIRILLDIFMFNGSSYDRFSEEFIETAYETKLIERLLSPYFEVLGIYNELTLDEPENDSERLYFVCKRRE